MEGMVKALAIAKAAHMPATVPTQSASTPRKVKLNSVSSQVDDTEVSLLNEAQLVAMYAEYERVNRLGESPPKDCEPTTEQISAIVHLLDNGLPPFADFASFSPYGHRIERKLKLSGVAIGRDGVTIGRLNCMGHPTLKKAVDLGVLLKSRSHIERLHDRYSDRAWASS